MSSLFDLVGSNSKQQSAVFVAQIVMKYQCLDFSFYDSVLVPCELFCFLGHKRDAARAENALTLSFGSELIGMQRDWNEELQSCREFPHSTDPERCSPFPFVQEYAYLLDFSNLCDFQVFKLQGNQVCF